MIVENNLKDTYEVFMNREEMLIARFNQLITEPEANAKQAGMVVDELIAIVRQSPGKKFNILIDLTSLGKASYISDQTREIYANAIKEKQIGKLAVIGHSSSYRKFLNLIIAAVKRESKVRWFTNVKKAITWLKNNKPKKVNHLF